MSETSSKKLYSTLKKLGIPVFYGVAKAMTSPPYIIYLGNGQDIFEADGICYMIENRYQIEYYYKEKNDDFEAQIESELLAAGYSYEKSEDVYVEDLECFLTYYHV